MAEVRAPARLALPAALLVAGALGWTALDGYAVYRARAAADDLRADGRYDDAWAALEAAVARSPGASGAWMDLGQTYRAAWTFRGKPALLERALAAYRQAARTNPLSALPPTELARTLSLAERHDEADAAYRAALRLDPRNPGLLVDHAQALERAGRNARALEQYRRAARIQPNAYSTDAERRLGNAR